MSKPFVLLGWQLSYFTGKTRSHLLYKGIPFVERPITFWQYGREAPRRTGAAVMPVLVTPEGEWWQDTSEIIDRLEARFPAPGIQPPGALQQVLDLLLEAWADEFWIPSAMHTRWNYPEANWDLFRREAGQGLLPWAPRFLQNFAARKARAAMQAHLANVGIVPAQYATIESWTRRMLTLLDAHFAAHDFLLGSRPCRADFALVGPFYGHLARDPWPKEHLVAQHAHVRRWLERMQFAHHANHPTHGADGAAGAAVNSRVEGNFLAEDAVAPSLLPVLHTVFTEFLGWCAGIAHEMNAVVPRPAPGKAWPRGLGPVEFTMDGQPFQRAALPYTLWMLQRVQDCLQAQLPAEQTRVRQWLAAQGGSAVAGLQFPRVERAGLRVATARTA